MGTFWKVFMDSILDNIISTFNFLGGKIFLWFMKECSYSKKLHDNVFENKITMVSVSSMQLTFEYYSKIC